MTRRPRAARKQRKAREFILQIDKNRVARLIAEKIGPHLFGVMVWPQCANHRSLRQLTLREILPRPKRRKAGRGKK